MKLIFIDLTEKYNIYFCIFFFVIFFYLPKAAATKAPKI
jgi:hypothetical protein